MKIKMGSGKFSIKQEMIWEQPVKVMRIMGECIIHDVHYNFGNRETIYYAQSPLFSEVEYTFDNVPEYYFAVDRENKVICQKTPFEFLDDFTPAKCEFTGRTDNLFAFHFDGDLHRPLYRVKDKIDGEDLSKEYHDIFTGVKVVIGESINETVD